MIDLKLMLFLFLFLFELILLFYLSKKLINSLAQIIYKFTNNPHLVINTLAIIFLPGTIIHELAHLLFAGVMLVPVGELNVIPVIEEKQVKLGSVQIGKTDPLRRSVIGIAPIILGLFCISSVFIFLNVGNAQTPLWQQALAFYLVFQIGNTMYSSKKDIGGVIIFVLTIFIVASLIIAAIYFINPQILQSILSFLSSLNYSHMLNFFKQVDTYLIAPIVLDVLLILVAWLMK